MRTEFLDETYKTRKAFEKLPKTVSKMGLKADSPATLATRKKNITNVIFSPSFLIGCKLPTKNCDIHK